MRETFLKKIKKNERDIFFICFSLDLFISIAPTTYHIITSLLISQYIHTMVDLDLSTLKELEKIMCSS